MKSSRFIKAILPEPREFNLYEKAESVRQMWSQIVHKQFRRSVGLVTEIDLKSVLDWLVEVEVAFDVERARRVISIEVGPLRLEHQGKITFDEFSRLFTKGVLKNALIDVAA